MILLLIPWMAGCVPVLESPDGADSGVTPGGGYLMPVNTWPKAEPPAGLDGEGFGVGEVIVDFRLPDQHGDTTSLYQFYGSVVLLDISTMWCAPCQAIAGDVQATADDYRPEGFVYVTVLAQDLGTDPPDQAELNQWADYFGIAEPVLSDVDGYYEDALPSDTFPGLLVIGRDMRIVARDLQPTDEAIRAAIEAAL